MNKQLLHDLNDLRNFKRAGHLGAWEYSEPKYEGDPVNGLLRWYRFLNEHPEYYFPRVENHIASLCALEMPAYIQEPVCLLSLGVGDVHNFRSKELTLTNQFNNIAQIVSCDLQPSYIQSSLEEASKSHPNAILEGMNVDFFQPFHVNTPHNILATMFGGTLFNEEGAVKDGLPVQSVVSRLSNIRDAIGENGYFFITVDHNHDKEKIENAYKGQGDFARNLVHLFNRDAHGVFNYDNSNFRVEWHPNSHVLAHYLTLEGAEYHINNSFKMPEETFRTCAKRSGFKTLYKKSYEQVKGYVLQAA